MHGVSRTNISRGYTRLLIGQKKVKKTYFFSQFKKKKKSMTKCIFCCCFSTLYKKKFHFLHCYFVSKSRFKIENKLSRHLCISISFYEHLNFFLSFLLLCTACTHLDRVFVDICKEADVDLVCGGRGGGGGGVGGRRLSSRLGRHANDVPVLVIWGRHPLQGVRPVHANVAVLKWENEGELLKLQQS
jgi:hypothetical protein